MTDSSASNPVVSVKSIDHVTIVSSDLQKTLEFYRDVLGMEHVERPDFGFDGLWLQAGDTQIHVNVDGPEVGGRAGVPDGGARTPSIGFHIAFLVDDGPRAAARLAAAGYELIDGPRLRPDGAHQFYVRDPDGHLIEIYSAPDLGES